MYRLLKVGLLIACLLPGCANKPQETKLITTELLTERERESVKKIKESAQHQIIGYIEEALFDVRDEEVSHRIYYIKNKYFKLLGFITEKGAAYRYDDEGNAEFIGDSTLEIAIRKLLKFTGSIYFEDFEVPPFFDDD